MDLKTLMSKANSWLGAPKSSKSKAYQPTLDHEGLIDAEDKSEEVFAEIREPGSLSNEIAIKTVESTSKTQSLERLQSGFDELVGQLQGINKHLDQQVVQHEELTSRMEKLPELLESFPGVVENQKQLTENLLEQLKMSTAKNQQFLEVIGKIPGETSKQTNALTEINNQLSASANTDVQMVDNFNKFNETIEKLNLNTASQRDSILQMSKTFSASDRYLKYVIGKQNRRFMWIFISALSVCGIVVLVLAGIIFYLK
ncbi:MAG: hypothetical protein FVQ80_02310 [Planctomycetes bacterium]|nr:hypothetical protein [Planctomycetota bacterium]